MRIMLENYEAFLDDKEEVAKNRMKMEG